MKTIFFIIFLLISIFGFSQNPSNYQYRTVRERLLAMMVDSSFHIPRYNGLPSGLRVGSAYHDGALAADTLNGRIYHYWNTTWNRLANYSDIAANTPNLQQVTDIGNTTTNGLIAPSFNDASSLFQLSVVAGQGRISLSNGSATDHIRPQAASAGSSNRLPNTGNANDTLFTFYDFRTLGGGGGGGSTRFGVSGEDDTPAENRIAGFTSNYVFNLRHLNSLTFDADSSNGAGVGYAFFGVNKYGLRTQMGSFPRTQGIPGSRGAMFLTDHNSGNHYAKILASPNGDPGNANYFMAFGDSLSTWLLPSSKYKIHNLPSGVGSQFLKYDPSNGEVTYDAGGGGGGSNFANADLTFDADHTHDLNGNILDIVDGAPLQFRIDPVNRIYMFGDVSADGNGTALVMRDTATVSPRVQLINLQEETGPKAMYYDPTSGKVTYDDAAGGTVDVNTEDWYSFKDEFPQNQSGNFEWNAAFSASVAALTTDIPDGWMFGGRFSTAASSTGLARTWVSPSAAGVHAGIAIVSGARFNVGWKIQLTDLSDGTDTYKIFAGFADNSQLSNVTDGVYFTYTHSASSGQFVCNTESNNSITSTASGVTVAADTDYELEISVFGGSAYFYINKTLVHTETSTIPTGNARATGVGASIEKSAGTNARDMLIDWGAYGVRAN